jgi:hypothetical protein
MSSSSLEARRGRRTSWSGPWWRCSLSSWFLNKNINRFFFYFSALTCPAATAALLLWRDWWLLSHFCLRLRALRRISRLSALLFALAGAPFAYIFFYLKWPAATRSYITICTLHCKVYSRPLGQFVVARSHIILTPFWRPLWVQCLRPEYDFILCSIE